jgi:hypothetical protein
MMGASFMAKFAAQKNHRDLWSGFGGCVGN